MTRPSITFVSPKNVSDKITCKCAEMLEQDLDISIRQVGTVPELFPLLSDHQFHTDIVAIDLERLIGRKDGIDMLDIINTLSTLIKCTVYRNGGGRPVRRTIKICLVVSDTIDHNLIRQAMLIPDTFISISIGGAFTYEMVKNDVCKFLSGDYTTPKPILDLLKSKKGIVIKKNTIDLTPREQQILNLIKDRGASNKVIAKMLDISESTVKLHIGKVLKKYGCKNRTQLALFGH